MNPKLAFATALLVLSASLAAQIPDRFARLGTPGLPTPNLGIASLAAGDLDGDGDEDLITGLANLFPGSSGARVYINNGRGNFADETNARLTSPGGFAEDLALGDIDKDGDLDLVIGFRALTPTGTNLNLLYVNDGTGRFSVAPAADFPPRANNTWSLKFLDIDVDGDLDLLVANQGPYNFFINDGTGKFTEDAGRVQAPGQFIALKVDIADLNGDGAPDVLVNGLADHVLINRSGRLFDETRAIFGTVPPQAIASLDLDQDQDRDLITSATTGPVRWLNDGAGNFTSAPGTNPSLFSSADAIDVDLDGNEDLVVKLGGGVQVWMLEGGTLRARYTATITGTNSNATTMDADQDGDVDLVLGSDNFPNGGNQLLFANLHRQITFQTPARIGQDFRLRAYAKPGYATTDEMVVHFVADSPVAGPRIPIPPFGSIGIDPNTMVVLDLGPILRTQGFRSTSYLIPNDATLVGKSFYIQSLFMPTSQQASWRLGNVRRATVQ